MPCPWTAPPAPPAAGLATLRATPGDALKDHIRTWGSALTGIEIYDDFFPFFKKNPSGVYAGPGGRVWAREERSAGGLWWGACLLAGPWGVPGTRAAVASSRAGYPFPRTDGARAARPAGKTARLELAHAVQLVGYSLPEAYWIAKSSWGTGFGAGGYFKVAMGKVRQRASSRGSLKGRKGEGDQWGFARLTPASVGQGCMCGVDVCVSWGGLPARALGPAA